MTSDHGVFNLLNSPWVRARTLAGQVVELSTVEVLAKAHELRGLAGEVATQDAAVFRLLEAILLGATRPIRPRSVHESLDLWAAWWRAGQLPMAEIEDYLELWKDYFFLLHDRTPFLQVADLHTASGNASGLTKLIADIPDGHQYFTTRAGREIQSLSFGEAARWLVHCHAFDPAGIKTGAVGDDRVKGGKGYSMGYPAWVGNLGVIIIEGASLFETLMLNLPVRLAKREDVPVWERSPLPAGVALDHPAPLGPADLLTWPSRRVRLIAQGERIVDVQISNGDRLGPQGQTGNEPMTSWRKSRAQSKGDNEVYMPVTHSPERRIWQGLEPLLVSAPGSSKRAPVLDWLAELRRDGAVASSRVLRLRTVGLEYGTQASSIVGAVDDGLSARVAALIDPVLIQAAVDAAARASQGVVALVNLSSNLALASGYDPKASPKDNDRRRATVFEFGYSLLDRPYRDWLGELDDPAEALQRLEDWGDQVRRLLIDAGLELIAEAGPAATVGRDIPQHGTETTQRIDAGLAEIWFRAALKKALVSQLPPVRAQEATS